MNIEQALTELARMRDRRTHLEKTVLYVADPSEEVKVTVWTRQGPTCQLAIERSELAAILQREVDDITARQNELQPVVDLANVALRGVAS